MRVCVVRVCMVPVGRALVQVAVQRSGRIGVGGEGQLRVCGGQRTAQRRGHRCLVRAVPEGGGEAALAHREGAFCWSGMGGKRKRSVTEAVPAYRTGGVGFKGWKAAEGVGTAAFTSGRSSKRPAAGDSEARALRSDGSPKASQRTSESPSFLDGLATEFLRVEEVGDFRRERVLFPLVQDRQTQSLFSKLQMETLVSDPV